MYGEGKESDPQIMECKTETLLSIYNRENVGFEVLGLGDTFRYYKVMK